ncbi:reactive intermediate/imine deaminase [Allostella vacuolata]|nr:reactive intermediate/imine deaminase [Stella vacuolata]
MIEHHFIPGLARPISPSSHAVVVDGWAFLTGQLGRDLDEADGPLFDGITAQTEQALRNMDRLLQSLGGSLASLVSVRVFLTEFDRDYAAMNAAYAGFFPEGARPARTCIGVTGLVKRALVEIDGIARLG